MSEKRITKWEQAFEKEGLDVNKMPDVSMIPKEYQKSVIAQYILIVVAKVLNEGWIPDYRDKSQYKYYPYFLVKANKNNKSGSGLSYLAYDSWYTVTFVGVLLCYKNSETAKYAGTKFKKLYEDLYLM